MFKKIVLLCLAWLMIGMIFICIYLNKINKKTNALFKSNVLISGDIATRKKGQITFLVDNPISSERFRALQEIVLSLTDDLGDTEIILKKFDIYNLPNLIKEN